MNALSAGALAIALALLSACSKQEPVRTVETPPIEVSPPPAHAATPPEPQPQTHLNLEAATTEPLPAPAPEPKSPAPGGTYFLIGSISIESSDGIERINPGTRLEKQPDGSFKDGQGGTFDLREDEVTNDPRIALRVAAADAANQAVIRQQLAGRRSSRRHAAPKAKLADGSFRPPAPVTAAVLE